MTQTLTHARTLLKTTLLALTAVAVLGGGQLAAHHSFAMYDMTVQKTLTGKLVRYVVGGNHSQFIFQTVNPDGSPVMVDGKPETWSIETAASVQLARRGITVDSFKPGTVFTITFSPLRDGRKGGASVEGSLIMCGTTVPPGGCNEKTGKRF